MKRVFLLLFAVLFVALAAGAQGMSASPGSAQGGTAINSTTTTHRRHHRKHHKHHHHKRNAN